jgi:hypothetical protein
MTRPASLPAAAALLAAAAGPAASFKPVSTDCLQWTQVSCDVTNCPNGETPPCCPNMIQDPLVVGFQLCTPSAGAPIQGVQGLQLCVSTDGAHVGHNSIFQGLGFKSECGAPHLTANHRGCWTTDMGGGTPQQQLNSFWRADFAQSNLSWSKFSKGDPVPSNAYHINGRLLARSTGSIPSSYGAKGSLVPGWVTPSGGQLGRMDYEDHGPLSEDTFFLATCHPPTRLRYKCDNATAQCVTVNTTGGGGDCADKSSSCAGAISSGLCSRPPGAVKWP